MVVHEKCLGYAFSFVIAGTDSDRVDVSPIGFRLWVNERITIDFARACQQDASTAALGDAQHIDGPQHGGLNRLDGVELVVTWRGGAGHVVDLIDLQKDGQGHIVSDQLKVGSV